MDGEAVTGFESNKVHTPLLACLSMESDRPHRLTFYYKRNHLCNSI
jgi:hypothetical protein